MQRFVQHNGNTVRWLGCASAVVLALTFLPRVSHGAPPSAGCQKVHGRFSVQLVTGAGCPSPVGTCASLTYQGAISGTSFFVASSAVPTVDTPVTGVILLTGDNTIQTRKGTLSSKDALVLKTTGNGEFAEVDTVIGGTGEFAGATGTLTATGTLVGTSGEGVYSGEVCTP